jgi:hypothetical protein
MILWCCVRLVLKFISNFAVLSDLEVGTGSLSLIRAMNLCPRYQASDLVFTAL